MKVSTGTPALMAYFIGRAQSVPPKSIRLIRWATLASESRSVIGNDSNRWAKAIVRHSGSVATVIMAIAADASRADRLVPAMCWLIEPDTSRPISVRFSAGTTFLKDLPNVQSRALRILVEGVHVS